MPVKSKEKNLQLAVCKFLKLQYPQVIFRSDLGGIKLTMGQAVQVKAIQHSRAFPDLFIAEPKNGFSGLFLELKRTGERVWLKNGSLSTDEHIQEQNKMLKNLRQRGYRAEFAIGIDDAINQINNYLK